MSLSLNTFSLFSMLLIVALFGTSQYARADLSYDEKLAFAGNLEETLGHFWAVEKNLDEHNAELALVHATHPVAELYDLMKPDLQTKDPKLDEQVKQVLLDLGKKTGKDVSREDAQKAIDEAKAVVEIARSTMVGDELSQDRDFKIKLMQGLLETSIGEYGEAIKNGQIDQMAEFQDGSAFVWRSQQIYGTIKTDISQNEASEIDEFYGDLWDGYDKHASPQDIETRADAIIHELDVVMGVESSEKELLDYVENVRSLLQQTKQEYADGNIDEALGLATKAYLDNFEYLEADVEKQNPDLKDDVEQMMRVELRNMIKNGEDPEKVSEQIDEILKKMDDVALVVPEFPLGVMIVMASVVGGVVAMTRIKGRILSNGF